MSDSSYTAVTRHRMLVSEKPTSRPSDLQLVDDEWAKSKLSSDDLNISAKHLVDEEEVCLLMNGIIPVYTHFIASLPSPFPSTHSNTSPPIPPLFWQSLAE